MSRGYDSVCIVFLAGIFILHYVEVIRTSAISDLPRAKIGCGKAIVKAEARTKQITSPGFPDAFPGDAECVWAIYANNGKRIRMEFQIFKLLQPIEGKCEHHYVIVKSPFSSNSMGPFCGEIGLPTIVSTGNLIYVELHTSREVDTDNYQGFKLIFKETVESSSYELRVDNSADDVIVTVDPATMNVLNPTFPTPGIPKMMKPTTKPWRFRPPRRPTNSARRPVVPAMRSPRTLLRNRLRPTGSRVITPTPETETVKIEILIAIGAGAVVAIAIVIIIAVLISKRRKRKHNIANTAKTESAGHNMKIWNHLPEANECPNGDPSYYNYQHPSYDVEYPDAYAVTSTKYETHVAAKHKSHGDQIPKPRKKRKRRRRQ